MTDTSDPRHVPPCHRVRAGNPPPMAFPSDPWSRADISRRVDPPAAPAPAPRTHRAVPRRRPSVLWAVLGIVVFIALVLPLTLHLVLSR